MYLQYFVKLKIRKWSMQNFRKIIISSHLVVINISGINVGVSYKTTALPVLASNLKECTHDIPFAFYLQYAGLVHKVV